MKKIDFIRSTVEWVGPVAQSVYRLSYGLEGPGSNPRWVRDFPPIQTGPGAHPASCTMGTASLLGVEAAGECC